MSNIGLASSVLKACWTAGVREIVICSGARNAPLVRAVAAQSAFRIHPFFEERSAGFFALGRILASGRPVAVMTTSGTAAAELLPAMIEADYQGLPLMAVTADRPRHYRGSGAPQTINQIGLYSHSVEKSWDFEGELTAPFEWSRRRPVHVNVCFSEPLIDAEIMPLHLSPLVDEGDAALDFTALTLKKTLKCDLRKPLIVVGGLPRSPREAIAKLLRGWQRPVYLESPSGLRGHKELASLEILGAEKSLAKLDYDGVIRIGSVPTLRLWRDLENSYLPVLHFSHLPFSGLPREPQVHSLEKLFELACDFVPWKEVTSDREISDARHVLLKEFSLSEPAWVEWLSREVPPGARVFLGNSLPIREWDFCGVRNSSHEIYANRGVNGIEGLISTFMGLAEAEKSNWCVIGDLSALYDLSGLWPNRELKMRDLNLVIVNNGGGRIFHRMFRNPLFENPHNLNFKAWAEMWGLEYVRLDSTKISLKPSRGPRVVEIIPDNEQTESFWNTWEKLR